MRGDPFELGFKQNIGLEKWFVPKGIHLQALGEKGLGWIRGLERLGRRKERGT